MTESSFPSDVNTSFSDKVHRATSQARTRAKVRGGKERMVGRRSQEISKVTKEVFSSETKAGQSED